MEQIPVDLITSEPSVQAGVAAMEQIHGRHLAEMTPEEQANAREHWRAQVEQILSAVRDAHGTAGDAQQGRAILTFLDAGEDQVDVGVALDPEPRELPSGDLEVTPAQAMALTALEAVTGEDEDDELD
jgi:hypothetical protein